MENPKFTANETVLFTNIFGKTSPATFLHYDKTEKEYLQIEVSSAQASNGVKPGHYQVREEAIAKISKTEKQPVKAAKQNQLNTTMANAKKEPEKKKPGRPAKDSSKASATKTTAKGSSSKPATKPAAKPVAKAAAKKTESKPKEKTKLSPSDAKKVRGLLAEVREIGNKYKKK